MTILTGVVLTIALGAVAQRGDVLEAFERTAAITPQDDLTTLPANIEAAWRLDVVANDAGATEEDGRRLLITAPPACGVAWRVDGTLAYAAGPGGCSGPQRVRYCLADGDACPEAVVTVLFSSTGEGPSSATDTPVARLEAGLPDAMTAAVSAARASGFTVEGARPGAPGAPLAAISTFGSLAPSGEAPASEARPDR